MRFLVLGAFLLAGCAATAGDVTLIPKSEGSLAKGKALQGDIYVDLDGERYSGQYAGIEDLGASFQSSGTAGAGWNSSWERIQASYEESGSVSSNTGTGSAYLTSPSGNIIRCKFRYTLAGGDSALGDCIDQRSREYELIIRPSTGGRVAAALLE